MQCLPAVCPGSSDKSLTRCCSSVNVRIMRKQRPMLLTLPANNVNTISAADGMIRRANKPQHGENSPTADGTHSSNTNSLSTTAAGHIPAGAISNVDHAIDSIGVGWFQYFVLFCVSLIWAGAVQLDGHCQSGAVACQQLEATKALP